jgi:hypothetical protein
MATHPLAHLDLLAVSEVDVRKLPLRLDLDEAMSVFGSVPTIFALNSSLSRSVTVTSSAFSTTWLFVMMLPVVRDDEARPERPPLLLPRHVAEEVC